MVASVAVGWGLALLGWGVVVVSGAILVHTNRAAAFLEQSVHGHADTHCGASLA